MQSAHPRPFDQLRSVSWINSQLRLLDRKLFANCTKCRCSDRKTIIISPGVCRCTFTKPIDNFYSIKTTSTWFLSVDRIFLWEIYFKTRPAIDTYHFFCSTVNINWFLVGLPRYPLGETFQFAHLRVTIDALEKISHTKVHALSKSVNFLNQCGN